MQGAKNTDRERLNQLLILTEQTQKNNEMIDESARAVSQMQQKQSRKYKGMNDHHSPSKIETGDRHHRLLNP
jgi:hypothetical protein